MLQSIFRNMQPVVKNLLIINVLFFLASVVFEKQGIDLGRILGLYYVGSSSFQPYQLATHFFMHDGFRHILFNMFGLVVFGNMLERIWGAKRFLIFYFATAIGAALLHQLIMGIEFYQVTGSFFPDIEHIFEVRNGAVYGDPTKGHLVESYINLIKPMVGASGAIFGLLAGVAMYFPNQVMLLYFAIRMKLKWVALFAGLIELYAIIQDSPTDSVAHFAHLGGALVGFILIKIWQRNRNDFY
ncbi:rhomboid family intramembrane serine protease [Crocinitomix sp.]|nr:rhomboid family intramembrane serine protease [Crocinitomix sp.]